MGLNNDEQDFSTLADMEGSIMKKIFALVIAVTLASSLMLAQSSRTSEVEFKAAQHKEEVVGDFKGAIDQYKRIAQSKDRALAAKALLRMAALYQKLGDAEAQKTYERVVREFRDQPEAVAAASARLASTGSTSVNKARQSLWTPPPSVSIFGEGFPRWPSPPLPRTRLGFTHAARSGNRHHSAAGAPFRNRYRQ